MSFKNEKANLHATIRYFVLLNVAMAAALVFSLSFNFKLYQGLAITVPPDLRTGALIKPGEKQPEDVFAFTATVFQAVQNWRTNGFEDYPRNIENTAPFITNDFRNTLLRDFERKRSEGELQGIARQLALPAEYMFGSNTIEVINSNEWLVKIPMEVKEYVDGQLVKDIEVLYSLIVRRVRTDVTRNAHQIAIDRFYEPPIRTKDFLSEKVAKQDVERLMDEL